MTLNRTLKLRRLSLFAATLVFAVMLLSKPFVLWCALPIPAPRTIAFRITDNLLSIYQGPTGTKPLNPAFKIQRNTTWYDPANIAVRTAGDPYLFFVLPLWFALALAAAPIPFFTWHIRVKARQHRCHNCNYNLNKNTSGRCPECGTEISPRTNNST